MSLRALATRWHLSNDYNPDVFGLSVRRSLVASAEKKESIITLVPDFRSVAC